MGMHVHPWGFMLMYGKTIQYCKVKVKIKDKKKSLQAINAGEGVEKREPSYTVGGNAN